MNSFEILVSRYFENDLNDEETAELQSLLKNDHERQAEFMAAAELHGRLKWELGQEAEAVPESSKIIPRRPSRRSVVKITGIAAAIGLSIMALQFLPLNFPGSLSPSERLAKQLAMGRVIHSDNGRWGGSAREIRVGEWLKSRHYFLSEGTVTIALDVGGVAQIEGPAEFEILAADRIMLLSGNWQARFEEPGQGFIVDTPNGEVVDLGTEFRINIGEEASEVEVVEGRVRLNSPKSGSKELGTREKMAMSQSGLTALDSSSASPMLSHFTYRKPVASYHWAFDGSEEGRFPGTSTDGTGNSYAFQTGKGSRAPERIDGVIGKAIRFSGEGEFIISPYKGVPGNKPRTVAAWIRIPKDVELKHAYGWAGWGYESYKGGHMHGRKWQLSWNPQVRMPRWTQPLSRGATVGAIRTEFGPGWVNGSRDLRDGEWHHLVSIFIGGENADVATHIRHYIDGHLEPTSGYEHYTVETVIDEEESLSLMMGDHMWSTIWSEKYLDDTGKEHTPYFTGFKGDVDELYIFEGALTPLQVWKLYKENTPPAPDEISPSIGTIDS